MEMAGDKDIPGRRLKITMMNTLPGKTCIATCRYVRRYIENEISYVHVCPFQIAIHVYNELHAKTIIGPLSGIHLQPTSK